MYDEWARQLIPSPPSDRGDLSSELHASLHANAVETLDHTLARIFFYPVRVEREVARRTGKVPALDLTTLSAQYPVAAQLATRAARRVSDELSACVDRLHSAATSPVRSLRGSLSRTLTLACDDSTIVYTPTRSALTKPFESVLTWLSEAAIGEPFVRPGELTRISDHVWRVQTRQEQLSYHRRCGLLLALLECFPGTHFDSDAVIGGAAFPFVANAEGLATDSCAADLLATGALGWWHVSANGYQEELGLGLDPDGQDALRDGYTRALEVLSRSGASSTELAALFAVKTRAPCAPERDTRAVVLSLRAELLRDEAKRLHFLQEHCGAAEADIDSLWWLELPMREISLHASIAKASLAQARAPVTLALVHGAARTGRPRHHARGANANEFISHAQAIGEHLAETCVADRWLALEQAPNRRVRLVETDHSLYFGTTGVLLFLAALEATTRSGTHRPLIDKVARAVCASWPARLQKEPVGGAISGLASEIYGVLKVVTLLGDAELCNAVHETALSLRARAATGSGVADVLSGTAGELLVWLAIAQMKDDAALADMAQRCGEVLLTVAPDRAGFSHGYAGVAYALSRIYLRTNERRFLSRAQTLIATERANHPRVPLSNWCNGTAGIALARLAALDVIDDDDVRVDIETALSSPPLLKDTYCCGEFGRVEMLALASRVLRRPELQQRAEELARGCIRRAPEPYWCDALRLGDALANWDTDCAPRPRIPGLFVGLSGVGYGLLRLANPTLPSPLIVE